MRRSTTLILLAVVITQVHTAPQLISFKEGKIGVNFGGYHAGVGLGGILGGGTAGGLFAEAGTPHGQSAKAGLGGVVDADGQTAGGLYAGATAGGNVKASTGLAGGVTAEKAAGSGYAAAQAGNHYSSSGLGGESSVEGSTGFSFAGSKSFGISTGVVKETESKPVQTVEVKPVQIEVQKEVRKEVQKEVNIDATNEVNFVPLAPAVNKNSEVIVETHVQPAVIVKEVYVHPPPPTVVEKHIIHRHFKPRHHFRKTAYIGSYVGDDIAPPPPPPPVVYKTVPVIEKRIDIGANTDVDADTSAVAYGGGGGNVAVTKQVTVQRNPNFFADIFNIPIQTLRAVGSFLGNAAGSTSVSVQKSASIHAGAGIGEESDSISPKHAASSSASSSEAHVSIQTPDAIKIIDDIFAIPINTLGAVNKFLENNIPARKTVRITEDGEPTKVRLGPHARRRANKRVVIVQETPENTDSEHQTSK